MYTSKKCEVCDENGELELESSDDISNGPFDYIQHRLLTQIIRRGTSKVILETVDIKNQKNKQIFVRTNVSVLSADELILLGVFLKKLQQVRDLEMNCHCCKTPEMQKQDVLNLLKNDRFVDNKYPIGKDICEKNTFNTYLLLLVIGLITFVSTLFILGA
jgi:hypothetical protein